MTDETLVVVCQGLPDTRQAQCLRHDLPDHEWQRISRLKQPEDRLRSLMARAMIRQLLGRRLDTAPAQVPLAAGPQGKPLLAGDTPRWHFNLAHSGELVLAAIGPAALGIDVEYCPPDVDEALWEFVTGRRPAASSSQAFCAEWVRREAVLKTRGSGLTAPPAQLSFAGDPAGWQQAGGSPEAAGLWVRLLWQSPVHCAALCLTAPTQAWSMSWTAAADWIGPNAPEG